MTEFDMMNKCYTCKHQGTVPGSAHICCKHPKIIKEHTPFRDIMATFASVGRHPPIGLTSNPLNIQADSHGIRSGWFNWPWNFDPVWLNRCDGYTPKEGHEK